MIWFFDVDLNLLLLYQNTIAIWFKLDNLDRCLPIGISEVRDNSPISYDLSFDIVTKYFKSDQNKIFRKLSCKTISTRAFYIFKKDKIFMFQYRSFYTFFFLSPYFFFCQNELITNIHFHFPIVFSSYTSCNSTFLCH